MNETDGSTGADQGMDRRRLLAGGGAAALAAGTALAGGAVLGASPAAAAPLVPILVPITPERIYDSRDPGSLGPISNGVGRILTAGPATDLAYLMNVTVVNTTGFGWLTIYSADDALPDTSTINWYGPNQTLVNNCYTWIRQSDSGINVDCGGGGSTQFILDLTAVLYLYDAGSPVLSAASLGSGAARGPFTAEPR